MTTFARFIGLVILVFAAGGSSAQSRLDLQTIKSLDEMKAYVRANLPAGTARDAVRTRLVAVAGATSVPHPTRSDVEKYLYDINLCGYYVWRWNISADFDADGRARQIYVNGEAALDGPADRFDPGATPPGRKGTITRGARARPEAAKGESSLAYILFDLDGDPATIHDRQLLGGGPTRLDPLDMGRLHTYRVDPWRSIFDADPAASIADYAGDCAAVDGAMTKAKG